MTWIGRTRKIFPNPLERGKLALDKTSCRPIIKKETISTPDPITTFIHVPHDTLVTIVDLLDIQTVFVRNLSQHDLQEIARRRKRHRCSMLLAKKNTKLDSSYFSVRCPLYQEGFLLKGN